MDTLIFSHRLHSEIEAGCTVCHAQTDSSLHPSDHLLPDMETCYGCHDRATACTLCHSANQCLSCHPQNQLDR